jgi:hypothetical protein
MTLTRTLRLLAVMPVVLGGCASTDFRLPKPSAADEATAGQQPVPTSLPMVTNKATATVTLWDDAAGDLVSSARYYDAGLFASAAAMVTGLVYKAHPDFIIGSALFGGAVGPGKWYFNPIGRANILGQGSKAMSCLAQASAQMQAVVSSTEYTAVITAANTVSGRLATARGFVAVDKDSGRLSRLNDAIVAANTALTAVRELRKTDGEAVKTAYRGYSDIWSHTNTKYMATIQDVTLGSFTSRLTSAIQEAATSRAAIDTARQALRPAPATLPPAVAADPTDSTTATKELNDAVGTLSAALGSSSLMTITDFPKDVQACVTQAA